MSNSLDDVNTLPANEAGETDALETDQSLGQALSVSFTVLKYLFVVLLAVFLFSGCFTVSSNEVAVRTRFGKVVGDGEGSEVLTAEGGPYFRWPKPIGEVYIVPTRDRTVRIEDSFVFATGDRDVGRRLAELGGPGPVLNPAVDGSLLTGDRSIVHARYEAVYRILPADAAKFVRALAGPDDAEDFAELDDNPDLLFQRADRIVRLAVEQAIVADTARKDIDEMYRGRNRQATPAAAPAVGSDLPTAADDAAVDGVTDLSPAGDDPVAGETTAEAPDASPTSTDTPTTPTTPDTPAGAAGGDDAAAALQQDAIRAAAQRTLDEMNAGITIQRVQRDDFTVPPVLRGVFESLSVAQTRRRQAVREAETEYSNRLTRAAGGGYEALLVLIDGYEAADRRVRADANNAEARQALEQVSEALRRLMVEEEPVGQVLGDFAASLPADDPLAERAGRLAREQAGVRLGGEALSAVRGARADSAAVRSETELELANFRSLLPKYRDAPQALKRQLFYNMLGDVLGSQDIELEVVNGELIRILVPVDRERSRQDNERAAQRTGGGGGGSGGGSGGGGGN